MDRVWGEQRESSRQGHIVSSGSSTDSDEPSAGEPRLLPTANPTATAKPSPDAYTGTLSQPKSPAAAQAGTPGKRPAHLPTLISKTPVPLPEFPKAAEFKIDSSKPKLKPKSASPSPSASSSSTSSSIPHAGAPKDRAAIRAQALLLTEESVLKQLAQAQASGDPPQLAASASQASSRIDEMHFATGGELLARIRQSASMSLDTHLYSPKAKPNNGHEARREDSSSKNDDEEQEDDDNDEEDDNDDSNGDNKDNATISLVGSHFKSSRSSKQDKNGGLTHALDGRLYYALPGPDDRDEPSRGGLIPTNYQLLPKSPRYICPVRSCRRLLSSVKSLGGHFSAKHCGEKFNDDCDGTLSLLETYKNTNSFSPGLIISQEPPRPDAPPPVEPSLPIWVPPHKRKPDMTTGSTCASASASSSTTLFDASSSIPSQVKAPLTEACQYLHSFLHASQTIHQREDISYMLQLPRRRDLPSSWIKHHRNTKLHTQFYAIALAFIVGDEIRGQKACTLRGHSSWRLSYKCPCIALPNSLPEKAKRAFNKEPTCVGCCYYSLIQRQKNPCDWVANGPYRSSSEEAEGREAAVAVDAKRIEKRDACRTAVVTPMAASPASLPQTVAGTREPRLKRSLADASAHAGPALKAARVSLANLSDPRAEANLSGPRAEASLEMESWEMAPGRLTDETGSENVAFSGAYVTSAQPVDALHDVGINIIVLKAGGSNRWVMEIDKARVCTVAAGKVRVKIGEQTFLLGPNGVFIVRPGQTCLVENRFYFDATIHCFSVKDYELVSEAT